MRHFKLAVLFAAFSLFSSCKFIDLLGIPGLGGGDDDSGSNNNKIRNIGGSPTPASKEIYATADLADLCVNHDSCGAPYTTLPSPFIRTENQEPLDDAICNFDYDPNAISTFVLNRVDGSVNGLDLLLSKEDLFFLAWVSVRYKINPYFLLGVLSQESYGNCAAVSSSHGEGCFQITNTFGQAQLGDSYPDRVENWNWTDRTDDYYPDSIFEDPAGYFGEDPQTDQFRLTLDPAAPAIHDVAVSSVVNFHFGVIASALYFHWQHYLLYHHDEDLRDEAADLFAEPDGKALWQAAAYNGGAYGAANALAEAGGNFLDEMRKETRDYAPAVADYCKEYEGGALTYSAAYGKNDVDWLIDLLAMTYSDKADIPWNLVKDDVNQVFFADDPDLKLSFVDDVKALIYVISTSSAPLAPEWPEKGSL